MRGLKAKLFAVPVAPESVSPSSLAGSNSIPNQRVQALWEIQE